MLQKRTRGRDLLLAAMRHLEDHLESTTGQCAVHDASKRGGLSSHYFGLRLANPLDERRNDELKLLMHQRGLYRVCSLPVQAIAPVNYCIRTDAFKLNANLEMD